MKSLTGNRYISYPNINYMFPHIRRTSKERFAYYLLEIDFNNLAIRKNQIEFVPTLISRIKVCLHRRNKGMKREGLPRVRVLSEKRKSFLLSNLQLIMNV